MKRLLRQFVEWLIDIPNRFSHFYRLRVAKIKRFFAKLRGLRWRDIEWFIKNTLKSIIDYFKSTSPNQMLVDLNDLVLNTIERIGAWSRRNWKTRTISVLFIVLLVAFLFFHLWLANLGRLHQQYLELHQTVRSARTQVVELGGSVNANSDKSLSQPSIDRISNLANDFNDIALEQPPKLFISYALRGNDAASQTIERLDGNEPGLVFRQSGAGLADYSILKASAAQILLFEDKISNAEQYAAVIDRQIRNINPSGDQFVIIDPSETIEIMQALLSEARLFSATGNEQRFRGSLDQLERELRRELTHQWQELSVSILTPLSEYESDYERLIFFNHNQYGLPTPEN